MHRNQSLQKAWNAKMTALDWPTKMIGQVVALELPHFSCLWMRIGKQLTHCVVCEIPIFRPTPAQVSFHFPHAWDIHKYCARKTKLKIRLEDAETRLRVAQEPRPHQWIKGTVLMISQS